MKKILFLSSAFIMTTLGAYAADGIITGGAGTCTVDVLGVSDNNATANTIATWSLNDYECGAGQYLDEDTLTCTTCPAGSYCPGGTFTIENASSGTFDCPAGYTESAAGAGTNNECYTACTVANANIAHATAVSGNDYYGTTDADTCTATDCELGYHVDGGEMTLVEKTSLIDGDIMLDTDSYGYIHSDGTKGALADELGLENNDTWAVKFDYGTVYGRAINKMNDNGISAAFAGLLLCYDVLNSAEPDFAYIESILSTEKVDFLKKLREQYKTGVIDSDTASTECSIFFMLKDTVEELIENMNPVEGDSCYCQITDFTKNGALKTNIVSAPVVLVNADNGANNDLECAKDCAENMGNKLVARAVLFDAVEYGMSGGMCAITETDCPAGQYLAVVGDAMMCVPCKSGSYCPGGVYTIESENKGTNACPTTHPNSDAGAGADTQCYTACTLETANIAHATAVSGNDYYGDGVDACYATECVKGYHTDGRIQFVEKTPAVTVDFNTLVGVAAKNGNGEVMQDGEIAVGLTENNTIAVSFTNGILYGRASCQPTMDTGAEYVFNNMNAVIDGSMSIEDFRAGLEPLAGVAKTNFAVECINAMKSGNLTDEEQTQWGNKLGAVFLADKNAGYSTSSTGQYCYVRADAFQPNGGNKSYLAGTPWMLYPQPFESADECATNCIIYGADFVLMQMPDVAFGALDYAEVATCAANTINIDWDPDNGGAHTQNMCTYDGAITLPDEPVKVGYTFSGWKLVEPNSTPVQ